MTPAPEILVLFLLLAAPPDRPGQPPGVAPPEPVTLEELEVTAPPVTPEPREPSLGATAPPAADLAARKAATPDAADLLRGLPGVSLRGAGGISSLPAIHGLADDRLRIQVDGTDLVPACPNHMNSPLSYADPARIESVTVFAGIAPVSVGGDSIGGSILVKSAPPEFAKPGERFAAHGLLGGFYRGNGTGLGYDLGATGSGEWLSVTLRQSGSQADGQRAGGSFKAAAPGTEGGALIPGGVIGSSAYEGSVRRSVGLALRARAHLLQAEVSQQKVGFEGFPNQRMDMTRNDNRLYALRYAGVFGWGDLEGRLSFQDTRHRMDMGPDRFSFGTGMPMETEGQTWAAAVKAVVDLGDRHLLRTGAECQARTLYDFWPPVGGTMGPSTFWNVDFGERLRVGAFAEWEVRWSEAWLTQAGLRSDVVATDAGPVQGYDDSLPAWGLDAAAFNGARRRRVDVNWDLAALVRYAPSAAQAYEAGYARKSRSPGLYQRYPWSTNPMAALMNNTLGDGNGYIGRIDLAPEVAHTLRALADWRGERWSVKAALHYTHVEGYVDARRCDFGQCSAENITATTGFVLLQYANHDARLYGLDLSGTLRIAEGPGWGSLTGGLALASLRGDNLTTRDGLYDVMPLEVRASLTHRLGAWTTSAEGVAVAPKRHVSRVRNEIPTAAYQFLHLRTGLDWKQLRIDASVENLLDRLYAHPQGGAYLGQGPSMSTTGIPWGVALPGPGRSVHIAVSTRF